MVVKRNSIIGDTAMSGKEEIQKRIAFLVSEIQRHQDLYYKRAAPEIPDREYDALFDELTALEKKYPDLALPDSPTKRVGSDLDNEFPEIRHPFPMLSLAKVYTPLELEKWIEKIEGERQVSFVIEEKIDGSTIVLHYEDGLLVRAVTRGDGFVGNDITENVKTVREIPLRLNESVTSVFRGEIYITKPDFEKLNREYDNIYANPRNFAAGSLRRKKSSEVAGIPLRAFVYEGLTDAEGMSEHIRVLHRLSELGFVVGDVGFFRRGNSGGLRHNPGGERGLSGEAEKSRSSETSGAPEGLFAEKNTLRVSVDGKSSDSTDETYLHTKSTGGKSNGDVDAFGGYERIFRAHTDWSHGNLEGVGPYIEKKLSEREKLSYEIDGLVAKVNEYPVRDALGYTAHHPRWAIAYKFEAPQAVSQILNIDVQVGRTGRITPVARIKPVWISGSTVSNVTLHNQDFITSLDIAVGDTVSVSRRGDVIPAVEDVLEKNEQGNRAFRMPDRCPVCNTGIVQEGAHHFCPNRKCPARVFGRIVFFTGRGQMDIENLGAETVKKLIDLKLIRDIPDIYKFDADHLLDEEGFGEKKVALIREGIEKSKGQSFETVFTSLGLDEIGPKAVELLIGAGYRSIGKLITAVGRGDPEIFSSIQGIGPKTAEKIITQFTDPFVIDMIDRLKEAGLKFSVSEKDEEKMLPKVFEGQVWCVTGSFEHFKPRDRAMDEVKKRGGRVVSSVSGSLTHLLVGENPGSKFEKAKKLNTAIVTEKEFLEMLEK